jgi:hypothetical protein
MTSVFIMYSLLCQSMFSSNISPPFLPASCSFLTCLTLYALRREAVCSTRMLIYWIAQHCMRGERTVSSSLTFGLCNSTLSTLGFILVATNDQKDPEETVGLWGPAICLEGLRQTRNTSVRLRFESHSRYKVKRQTSCGVTDTRLDSENRLPFVETRVSLLCSQELIIGPHSKPDESSPDPYILFL